MIEISIFGQHYEVPPELTILRAVEWSGFCLTRGVGCRGGFCGACGTVWRRRGEVSLHYALACQTLVEPGMILGTIPYFPPARADYHLASVPPTGAGLLAQYPEIMRCYGCNTCTKACPQAIDVLGYVAASVRGDLTETAAMSFDCIMCGLCTARCPAELDPPAVALLARRLVGKFLTPPAPHLARRCTTIDGGAGADDIDALCALPMVDLKKRYENRVIEA